MHASFAISYSKKQRLDLSGWALLASEGADPEWLESLAGRGVRFVASDTTGIYCLPTCSHARRIGDRHRVELRSEREARDAGFRPCRVCGPSPY